MSPTQNQIRLTPLTNRFAVKRNYILNPIDSLDLVNALVRSNMGFMPMVPPRSPRVPFGARLDPVGQIARKGGTTVDYDYVSQITGVEGINPSEVTATLAEVESIIRDGLDVNIEENIRFYESSSVYLVETGKNPLKMLSKLSFPREIYSSLGSLLGMPITSQAIHISQKSDTIENVEWFDMNIEPQSNRSSTRYSITIIFRRPIRSPVAEFLNSIDPTIMKVLETIESYSNT